MIMRKSTSTSLSGSNLSDSKSGQQNSMEGISFSFNPMFRWFMVGTAIGAVGMYFFDPKGGNRRRALMRDKTARADRLLMQFFDKRSRDVWNRVYGAYVELRMAWREREMGIDNDILVERIRSKLGRVCSHPKLVNIQVRNGHVWLTGLALKREIPRVYQIVKSVRGIHSVSNALQAVKGEREISATASAIGAVGSTVSH